MRSDLKPLIELQIRDIAATVYSNPYESTVTKVEQRYNLHELRKCLPISTDTIITQDGLVIKPLILVGGKLFKLFVTTAPSIRASCTTCYIEDAYLNRIVHSFGMLDVLEEGIGYLYQRVRKELNRRRIDVEGFYL